MIELMRDAIKHEELEISEGKQKLLLEMNVPEGVTKIKIDLHEAIKENDILVFNLKEEE